VTRSSTGGRRCGGSPGRRGSLHVPVSSLVRNSISPISGSLSVAKGFESAPLSSIPREIKVAGTNPGRLIGGRAVRLRLAPSSGTPACRRISRGLLGAGRAWSRSHGTIVENTWPGRTSTSGDLKLSHGLRLTLLACVLAEHARNDRRHDGSGPSESSLQRVPRPGGRDHDNVGIRREDLYDLVGITRRGPRAEAFEYLLSSAASVSTSVLTARPSLPLLSERSQP
jgi:hypothetical protein